MKGYLNIPESICVTSCRECGARPVIATAGIQGYFIKCPANESHYQTQPGLIDIEDWNLNNTIASSNDQTFNPISIQA